MDSLIEWLQLDRISDLLLWVCIAKIAAFYMQRPHYENPNRQGSIFPGPWFLSALANLMGWVLFLLPLWVWFRVGLGSAVALFVISFVVLQVSTVIDLFLWRRFSSTAMALISTPIAILAFVMSMLASGRL